MADETWEEPCGFKAPRRFVPDQREDLSSLVTDGVITRQQLDDAVALAEASHANAAGVLLSQDFVTELQLAVARGKSWGIEAVDLAHERFERDLARRRSGPEYIRRGWLPIRRDTDGRLLVATFFAPTPQLRDEVELELDGQVRFVATSRWALREAVLDIFADYFADHARDALGASDPLLSARKVLSRAQAVGGGALIVAYAVCLVIWTLSTIVWTVAVGSIVFLLATTFKYVVALHGSRYDVVEQLTPAEVEAVDDNALPMYTVLVPVFREANVVARLIANLRTLDYPRHKLEVLVLVEEEDHETRDAITAADPPANFHVLTIPKGTPQTKPRACNVGLAVATGELLVIYDAEDVPDADQLKKAYLAFQRGGEDLVCVQAALSYFNDSENVLTRMFTLEYGFWFYYMLTGLEAARLPIPLGGTSNHFRVSGLRALGGWDPYNVTEDADLGIRASALGYRVGIINSTTLEEANNAFPNFIRQRSRWIKGYLQTSIVHARQPRRLVRQIGWVSFLSFVLLVAGTPITFLGVIPSFVVTFVSIWLEHVTIADLVPAWVMWIMLFNFTVGNAVMIYVNMMGPFKRGQYYLVPWAILNPLYWILHSIAAYKAVWQLVTRPHFWEKTTHGLTTHLSPTERQAPDVERQPAA
ncbi:glycosyltransferase [Gryllotalpicola daejeonensis]|uniref:Glycosyltransferase n=1 Tax=Gryllotalpicola daejeonensis TaxID=993087 RepID=A0ABP7ZMF0_9MICO